MITYIELWKSKQAWLDLSKEERGNYLTALGPAIQQLMESGVQIVSWEITQLLLLAGQIMITSRFGHFQTWKQLKISKKWLRQQVGTIILNR